MESSTNPTTSSASSQMQSHQLHTEDNRPINLFTSPPQCRSPNRATNRGDTTDHGDEASASESTYSSSEKGRESWDEDDETALEVELAIEANLRRAAQASGRGSQNDSQFTGQQQLQPQQPSNTNNESSRSHNQIPVSEPYNNPWTVDDENHEQGQGILDSQDDLYYVVKQTRPIINDKNRKFVEAKMKAESTFEILGKQSGIWGWPNACNEARRYRNECPHFDGACTIDEYDSDLEATFDFFTEPPWDSGDHPFNDSRDTDVVIHVMTRDQCDIWLEEQLSCKQYVEDRMQEFERVLKTRENRLRIKASGARAYYSYPWPKDWDIKAAMVIREDNDWREDALLKINPDARRVTSLAYSGCKTGSLGDFMLACLHDANAIDKEQLEKLYNEDFEVSMEEIESVGLLRHLRACESLEDLFIQMRQVAKVRACPPYRKIAESSDLDMARVTHSSATESELQKQVHSTSESTDTTSKTKQRRDLPYNHIVTDVFMKKVLKAAPHISEIMVLSFGPCTKIHPNAFNVIGEHFDDLMRLDIQYAFSLVYSPKSALPSVDSLEDKLDNFPYATALLNLVRKCESLVRLDLRHSVSIDDHCEDDAMIFPVTNFVPMKYIDKIRDMLNERGGKLCINSQTELPDADEDYLLKVRMRALKQMGEDTTLAKDCSSIARLYWKGMADDLRQTGCWDSEDDERNLERYVRPPSPMFDDDAGDIFREPSQHTQTVITVDDDKDNTESTESNTNMAVDETIANKIETETRATSGQTDESSTLPHKRQNKEGHHDAKSKVPRLPLFL